MDNEKDKSLKKIWTFEASGDIPSFFYEDLNKNVKEGKCEIVSVNLKPQKVKYTLQSCIIENDKPDLST